MLIIIQDKMLQAAIAGTLQIEKADITERKLEELMTLSARSSGVISLEELQYAVNLKYLDLCGNAIEDLTPTRDLWKIEVLNLSKNILHGIQALKEFQQLLRLDILRSNLYTTDIGTLAGMINLGELNLERGKADNLVYLENIKKLKKLYVGIENGLFPLNILGMLEELEEFHMNRVWLYDIAGLTYLRRIKVLDVSANLFCDLSPLQYVKDSLRNLNISNCEYLRDLSILEEFPNLEVLDISFDHIKDFSFLEKLKSLENPRATQSGLCDLHNLKGLIRMEKLDISENCVGHTKILREMKLLRYFKASCCFLRGIGFLKNTKDLVELNVFNNYVKYIEVLEGCEHMTTLDVGNSDIHSIDSLKDMVNLECLRLSRNNISDLTPLKDLTNLSTIDLYDNVITSLSPLKKPINLGSLRLGHNSVMDLSLLEECIYLNFLALKANYVTDVTPLTRLKNLYGLRLDENPIEDIIALGGMEYYERFSYWDSLKRCKFLRF